jgi:hypothetical protein
MSGVMRALFNNPGISIQSPKNLTTEIQMIFSGACSSVCVHFDEATDMITLGIPASWDDVPRFALKRYRYEVEHLDGGMIRFRILRKKKFFFF